jgi:hypothetical protein
MNGLVVTLYCYLSLTFADEYSSICLCEEYFDVLYWGAEKIRWGKKIKAG